MGFVPVLSFYTPSPKPTIMHKTRLRFRQIDLLFLFRRPLPFALGLLSFAFGLTPNGSLDLVLAQANKRPSQRLPSKRPPLLRLPGPRPNALRLPPTPGKKRAKPYQDPFAPVIMRLGQEFHKTVKKQWRMEWSLSSQRELHWRAGAQQGYRIRFVHRSRKTVVPKPFPDFSKPDANTEVVALRCSFHFFPRRGSYRAQESALLRHKPARLVAVSKQALIFQANPFLARERPCPRLRRRLLRFLKIPKSKKTVTRTCRRLMPKKTLRRAQLWGRALWLQMRQDKAFNYRALARRFQVQTLVLEHKTPEQRTTEVRHP